LFIDGQKKEIMDAHMLWGLDTAETEKKLKEIHGKRFKLHQLEKLVKIFP